MSDEVLTVAQLERLSAQAEEYAECCRETINWPTLPVWFTTLARVCRHALALEAEVDRLQQLRLGAANEAQNCRDENTRLCREVACLRRQVEGRDRPRRVCLCGSTRFMAEYAQANFRETMAGRIVLTVGNNPLCPDQRDSLTEAQKADLDRLHLAKIDLADEVLILDVLRPRCPVCKTWWELKWQDIGRFFAWTCVCDGHVAAPKRVPYIGESTSREIQYAVQTGKKVRYLSEERHEVYEDDGDA
jgi:hypothetical protein